MFAKHADITWSPERKAVSAYPPAASRRTSRLPADLTWGVAWGGGMLALTLWNAIFLNEPAFLLFLTAFLHSLMAGIITVASAMALGWSAGIGLFFLDTPRMQSLRLALMFTVSIIRSVPQLLGLLGGYAILTLLILDRTIESAFVQLLWMSLCTSLFLFPEVSDLVDGRLRHFKSLDFYPAMICCGIPRSRIINVEILQKNSAPHLIHKIIALFGGALFLQTSVDFIVSVGLSTDVSLSNFPVTLGNLLARLDSKQDILAIGKTLTDPSYAAELFTRHLQGVSTAWTIVFSLICARKAADAFVRRKGL